MNNIAAHAERIARHYWGEPNAKLSVKGRTLRWGNKGSLFVIWRRRLRASMLLWTTGKNWRQRETHCLLRWMAW